MAFYDEIHIHANMAYNSARSGSRIAANEIACKAQNLLNKVQLKNVESIQCAQKLASSLFLFSLSWIDNYDNIFRSLSEATSETLLLYITEINSIKKSKLPANEFISISNHLLISGMMKWDSCYYLLCQIIAIMSREKYILENEKVKWKKLEIIYNKGVWLHSTIYVKPLVDLWLHSIKQKKIRCNNNDNNINDSNFTRNLSRKKISPGTKLAKLENLDNLEKIFGNNLNEPLVVDVGCGFGVSLLGMAYTLINTNYNELYSNNNDDNNLNNNKSWRKDIKIPQNANFLGFDLNEHAINYARTISKKWKISTRCCFIVSSAQAVLEWLINNYKGFFILF
jgi:hypothetical protein